MTKTYLEFDLWIFMILSVYCFSPISRNISFYMDSNDSPMIASPSVSISPAARTDPAVNEETFTCTICLDIVEHGAFIRTLPACGHKFHARCINQWLVNNTSCPNCRIDVIPS